MQRHPKEKTLEYESSEAQVISNIICHLREKCHGQLFNLRRDLKEFGVEGVRGVKKELTQMHERVGFCAVAVSELSRRERQRAQEGLMLLTRKKSGEINGRLVYNGKGTRSWISREDKSSPTILNESLMLTCAINPFEKCNIMTLNIPNAYIQAEVPPQEKGERIVMKIRGKLVDWLCQVDSTAYLPFVVIEKSVRVLYLLVTRAIYDMLQVGLLWYRKLRCDLEGQGFVFNLYNPCVANRMIKECQHTVRLHVDDVLSSHVDSKVNDTFAKWCQEKYGELKDVEVRRGKVHRFLGMVLDFSCEGVCHVKQYDHVSDMIANYDVKIGDKTAFTPVSNHLFEKEEGSLLSDAERDAFHSTVAKALYISTRSRPDIIPTVSVLSGRVREPTTSDKEKLIKFLKYLNGTRDLHLTLRYDGMSIARWNIDSSFACHPDFRSQSGGVFLIHPDGRGIASSSTKQKLNTRSSTMSELVAVDNFYPRFSGLGTSCLNRG